jgi:hypothetical protein
MGNGNAGAYHAVFRMDPAWAQRALLRRATIGLPFSTR